MATRRSVAAIFSLAVVAGLSSASAENDVLTKARLAAVEGDHITCARLADEARQQPRADGRVHHLYATCQAFAAEARRSQLSEREYATELGKAIAAYQLLLRTPGLLPHLEERASVEFIVEELQGRIAGLPSGSD